MHHYIAHTLATLLAISLLFVASPKPSRLQTGTMRSPTGATFAINSRFISLNGRPWIPTTGEFHYGRYPQREWYKELLKMKAGGVNVVSTYVFWIYQEQQPGVWNWRGRRSLRIFLLDCKKAGLFAMVRMGPWAHGEVRNGGIPDWVLRTGCRIRSTDPRFMKLANGLYHQIAIQMKGLLWKQGGPVIGVQMDNETGDTAYLYALKKLAIKNGIDVPFYTMTGWSRFNHLGNQLQPMFGGYPVGFWTGSTRANRYVYRFAVAPTYPTKSPFHGFPYTTCETGGGMASSYAHRTLVNGPDIAAFAMMEIANGSNWQGFYMYHGGWNPRGDRPYYLNEYHGPKWSNEMPLINYDFQAPLGACGQQRPQYRLLRQQALFTHDFGAMLAPMPAAAPAHLPAGLHDTATLRWDVRSNGRAGFIFFNNYIYDHPLPAKKNIQFNLQTTAGKLRVPDHPITIGKGIFGWWPFNLSCGGQLIRYATAEPLCHIRAGGRLYEIFSATAGVAPEFVIRSGAPVKTLGGTLSTLPGGYEKISGIKPGTGIAFSVRIHTRAGALQQIAFIVLTPQQALDLTKITFAGRTRCVISTAELLPGRQRLRLETTHSQGGSLAILPKVNILHINGSVAVGIPDGAFVQYKLPASHANVEPVKLQFVRAANLTGAAKLLSRQPHQWTHADWRNAALWRISIPPADRGSHLILRIHYLGNVLHVRSGGKLLVDDFYHGKPLDVPLWRIAPTNRGRVDIQLMPLYPHFRVIMPPQVDIRFSGAQPLCQVSGVTVLRQRIIDCATDAAAGSAVRP